MATIFVSSKILAACAAGTLALAPVVSPTVRHEVTKRAHSVKKHVKHKTATVARSIADKAEPVPCIPVGAAAMPTIPIPPQEPPLPPGLGEHLPPVDFNPPRNNPPLVWIDTGDWGGDYFPPTIINPPKPPVIPEKPPTAGVPEPSTWLMFVIGFGAIGTTIRHSNKKIKQVSA